MFYELEKLTPKELEHLRNTLNKKRPLLIVHPFFEEKDKNFLDFITSKRAEKYLIIIAEEHQHRYTTEQLLKENHKKNNLTIVTYSTKKIDPTPIIGWQRLLKKFQLLGLERKRIIIGGNRLDFESLNELKLWLGEWKMDTGLGTMKKRRKVIETIRTRIRAAENKRLKKASTACAGYTASKINAHPGFKAKITRHFSK